MREKHTSSLGESLCRRNKYSAIKTVCGAAHKHDSKREAAKCDQLHLAVKAGYISALEFQVPYQLFGYSMATGERRLICKYVADFRYLDSGKTVVMDVKGMRTPIYNLKKKLMLACWGIEIEEDGIARKRS
ncbi:MAG: DUF1064 domain-containing protein [Candidatus Acidiferrales bacterium]